MTLLIPIERPHCRQCQNRMASIAVAPNGSSVTIKCGQCGYTVAHELAEPLEHSAGWINSSLQPPG